MDQQLQVSTATYTGRHNHEFSLISRFFSNKRLRILSFGCSTGEEAQLLADLFPSSAITGVDINRTALDRAQRTYPHLSFVHSSDLDSRHFSEHFDLICACSVLCQFPPNSTNGKTRGIPFDYWHTALTRLHDMLKPGGILFLYNSNYPFRFHKLYNTFNAVDDPAFNGNGFVDLFDECGNVAAYSSLSTNLARSGNIFHWHKGSVNRDKLIPNDFKHACFQKHGGMPISRFSAEAASDSEPLYTSECSLSASKKLSCAPPFSATNNVTFVEVKLACQVMPDNSIIINRTLSRIWFDNSIAYQTTNSFVYDKLDARWFLKAFKGFSEYLPGIS